MDMEPEDLPQVGKKRQCFKFKAENAIYYVAANSDQEMFHWFNLLKQQMSKIATEYNVRLEMLEFKLNSISTKSDLNSA